MRERKWRVWTKKWRGWAEGEGAMVLLPTKDNSLCGLRGLADEEGWHVMDYTGLQDADSKDIYESDILLYPNGIHYIVKHGHWRHVDCPDSLYGWFVQDSHGWEWPLSSIGRIAGNIWENENLMEQNDKGLPA
jgi:hypothetical protein